MDEEYEFTEDEKIKINKKLLNWYDENHRKLQWRTHSSDKTTEKINLNERAYQVWISEIMLQQTKVETVKSYYKRWMDRFNTLEELSKSDIEEVNKYWSGLGFYRRANNLHKASQKVMKEYNGVIPNTVKELIKLPGIGEYTAGISSYFYYNQGAICSIVYNQVEPVVDGNVFRVLSRIKTVKVEISKKKIFWKLAKELINEERPGGNLKK
jgi:A/G-specific adenine glycosylase